MKGRKVGNALVQTSNREITSTTKTAERQHR